MKSIVRKKYSIVDLFAGAGGLSYGFLQTGRFEVKAAFENNRNAQKTYKKTMAMPQFMMMLPMPSQLKLNRSSAW